MRRLAVLAALLALTGCGGQKHSTATRDSVSRYISGVNAIEFTLRAQLVAVSSATTAFVHAHDVKTATAALARAQRTFEKLHGDLARLRPPPQARKLHLLLLELIAQEASLAGELRDLSAFNPAFADALHPLAVANAAVQKTLKSAKKPGQVAAGVHAYRSEVAAAIVRLRRLHPPTVERPLFEAQLQRLVALGATLAQLEGAVNARDRTAIAKAEHAVGVASVSSDARSRQVAQRAAVVTYNARVRAVQALARRVQRERDRLQVALP
jgi:hypothetical protein